MTAKTKKKLLSKSRPVPMVTLTAFWGNGDAQSSFRMPASRWKKVQDGLPYTRNTYGWYEGKRQCVTWRFNTRENKIGRFSIDGEDGRQCVVYYPISEIIIG